MNRAAAALPVSEGQRAMLETLSRSSSAPHREVLRARALVLAADGVANDRIAAEWGCRRRRCGPGGGGSPTTG